MYCWSANELGAKFIAQIVQSFRKFAAVFGDFFLRSFFGRNFGWNVGGICFSYPTERRNTYSYTSYDTSWYVMLCAVPNRYVYTRRFAPQVACAARYARSQGRINKSKNKADREFHDFANRRLGNAKSFMLLDNNPDATCMYEIHRKGQSERAVLYLTEIETKVRSFAHHTTAV